MEKHFLTLVLICLCICSGLAQKSDDASNEAMFSFRKEQIELMDYLNKVAADIDTAIANTDYNQLIQLGSLFKQDFGNITSGERYSLRHAAMLAGHKIWKVTGNRQAALDVYLVAHQNVENKQTLDSLAWYVENVISNYYTMMDDYEKSQYYSTLLENSLKHFQMFELLSRHYTNLGRKLKSELKPGNAKAVFEQGYRLADSIGYSTGVFSNAIQLTSLFNEFPELGSAEVYLLKAEEILPFLQSEGKFLDKKASLQAERARFHINNGECEKGIYFFDSAIISLDQYYTGLNRDRREFAKLYGELASAYICADSLVLAELAIFEGLDRLIPDSISIAELPRRDQLYPENSFVELLVIKAYIQELYFKKSGDTSHLSVAIGAIELALYTNDLIRESVIGDLSKLISIDNNKDLIGKGLYYLQVLYNQDPNSYYLGKARSFFSQSKALLFSEKNRKINLLAIMSPADREKCIELQKEIMKLHEEKFIKGADINAINGQILHCQEQLEEIFSRYNERLFNTSRPENYIEYFVDENAVYVFSEIHGQINFVKLNEKSTFDQLAARLNEYILLKGWSMDDTILSNMYQFLVKPVIKEWPSTLVIIPDGAVGYVPFEMLRDDDGSYLLEKCTIAYSFEYIIQESSAPRINKPWEIFCLAPDYKKREVMIPEATRGTVYHLPFAKMEVDSIKGIYGNSVMVSESGEKQLWLSHIDQADIFHYAGHAIINGDKAYLALNSHEDEKDQLTSKEIGLMHHPLSLVVLSACETGLGELADGEGIRSLGRSFMESGAKATVISLWNVNDKSTAAIMVGFYHYLKKGLQKDEALRLSKIDYLKTASGRYSHPYYWAAFIPAGNMKPLSSMNE